MNKQKPVEYSAAIVIYNQDRSKFLLTKRPARDESMPTYWGFPAATKKDVSEDWEKTAKRAAKTKLGVEVKIIKNLGEDTIDRGDYILVLRDYEVEIVSGEPVVPQNVPGVTQYSKQKWTSSTSELARAAKDGSLCSRVFLRSKNIPW